MHAETVGPVHPADPPVTVPYEVIHLGGQAAVIVPLPEFLRLRALESTASPQALEDAEDAAGLLGLLARLRELGSRVMSAAPDPGGGAFASRDATRGLSSARPAT